MDGGSHLASRDNRGRYPRRVPVQEERPPSIAVHEAWLPAEHPLHRPRHGGRQRTALLSALIFFLAPLLALSLGVRPAEFENRSLTDFPGPGDGWGLSTDLPAWAADHLPFRDVAIRAADRVSHRVFDEPSPLDTRTGEGNPGPVGPIAPPAPPAWSGPQVPAEPSTSTVPGVFPQVVAGRDGWLYFGYDVEAKCAPARPLGDTIAAVNRLRDIVEASGRRFVLVVPPDKTTAQPDFLPADYPGRDCSRAASREFWQRVPAQTRALDLRADLRALSAPAHPGYHKLDTHWTDRGAIAMVRALAERIEPGSTDTWKVQQLRTVQSGADLPTLLGRTGVNFYQQYSLAPSGGLDRAGPYIDDLTVPVRLGSGPVGGVVTDPVGLLGDSFSKAPARYLDAGFADVQVVSYATSPEAIGAAMADRRVVVLEVVERNLASGVVPLLQPAALEALAREFAARPLN